MAISGPASYVPTSEEFLGHWDSADTTLGVGNELKLKDGSGRAVLVTKKDLLIVKRTTVQARLNQQEVARGDIEVRKAALLERINQFNDKVRFLHGGAKWERALPQVPSITDGQGKFTEPLDDAATLWLMINDDVTLTDIVLLGGYTQAMFVADIAALNAAYTNYNAASAKVTVAIEDRNDVQDEIYEMLKQYRQAVPTYFVKTHALVQSLPRLTPEPGSTPDAVTANGSWIVASLMAKLLWTLSTDANLLHYEIRFCAGPNYSADNESVIGTVLPSAPREFLTDAGLSNPGNVASFKVYVVTTTGNEKGSNTVTITRPAA